MKLKLKLKLTRRQLAVSAAVLVALAAVAVSANRTGAGPTTLDTAGSEACTIFARDAPDARTRTDRLALADRVTARSAESDHRVVADRAMEIGRAAGESTTVWRRSRDAFLKACRDAGWTGRSGS